jgi:hypothetical protein
MTYVCIRGGPQKPALAPRPLKIYCACDDINPNYSQQISIKKIYIGAVAAIFANS